MRIEPRLSRAEVERIRNGEACSGCEQHPEIQRDLANSALALYDAYDALRKAYDATEDAWRDAAGTEHLALRTAEARVARLEGALRVAEFVMDIGARLGSKAGDEEWNGYFREGMAAYKKLRGDEFGTGPHLTLGGIRALLVQHLTEALANAHPSYRKSSTALTAAPVVGTSEPCKRCDGKGDVNYLGSHVRTMDCSDCGGTGRAPTSPRQMLEQVAVEEAETYYRGPCPMCHGSGTVVTEPLHASPPAPHTCGLDDARGCAACSVPTSPPASRCDGSCASSPTGDCACDPTSPPAPPTHAVQVAREEPVHSPLPEGRSNRPAAPTSPPASSDACDTCGNWAVRFAHGNDGWKWRCEACDAAARPTPPTSPPAPTSPYCGAWCAGKLHDTPTSPPASPCPYGNAFCCVHSAPTSPPAEPTR